MPLRIDVADALALGQALYNERRFWDAHEAWERGWLIESGEVKRMLQGLILVTAGYHNAFVRGRRGSVVKQLGAGIEKLEGIPDELGGLSLGEFRAAVAVTLVEARRWHRGESDGLLLEAVPRLLSR